MESKLVQKPDLVGAISYTNPAMVKRFAERNNTTVEYAQELFEECKKFLTLCTTMTGPMSPSKELDEMWYHFVLHTKDYTEYCAKYLGRFIHHNQTDAPEYFDMKPALDLASNMFGAEDAYVLKMMAANAAECRSGQ